MALASINFQKATGHAFRHNDRSDKVTYLVDRSDENEVSRSATDARAMADRLYAQAIEKLTAAKVKRKPKAENSRWEAVVNLNAGHGLDDVQQLAQAIEKETGFTVLQIAVHKDEGKSAKEKNYHAHIVFHTLDRDTGRQLYRREHMTPARLTRLQDLTAETLGMQRGRHVKETGRKRLDHRAYKQQAQERAVQERERDEAIEQLAKIRDVSEQYRAEREALKASGEATQRQYQELKQRYDELKEQARARELTIGKLRQELAEARETTRKAEDDLRDVQEDKKAVEAKYDMLEERQRKRNEEAAALVEEIGIEKPKTWGTFWEAVKAKFREFKEQIVTLTRERDQLREENEHLKAKISESLSPREQLYAEIRERTGIEEDELRTYPLDELPRMIEEFCHFSDIDAPDHDWIRERIEEIKQKDDIEKLAAKGEESGQSLEEAMRDLDGWLDRGRGPRTR